MIKFLQIPPDPRAFEKPRRANTPQSNSRPLPAPPLERIDNDTDRQQERIERPDRTDRQIPDRIERPERTERPLPEWNDRLPDRIEKNYPDRNEWPLPERTDKNTERNDKQTNDRLPDKNEWPLPERIDRNIPERHDRQNNHAENRQDNRPLELRQDRHTEVRTDNRHSSEVRHSGPLDVRDRHSNPIPERYDRNERSEWHWNPKERQNPSEIQLPAERQDLIPTEYRHISRLLQWNDTSHIVLERRVLQENRHDRPPERPEKPDLKVQERCSFECKNETR